MWDVLSWVIILAVGAAVIAIGAVLGKAYLTGVSPSEVFFKPRAEPRLEVVEYASLDSKRRLVLIRRDDVEHLIMTGGPVDVVVETGIGEASARRTVDPPVAHEFVPVGAATTAPAATVFTRAPRPFGQATVAASPMTAEDAADMALKR